MPIYEYECTECNELHEALQKVSDDLLTVCPACGKSALRKKVSAAAFRLKGSGWYETDFKSGNKKNLAGDGGSDSSGGSAGNSTGDSGKAGGDTGSSAEGKSKSGADKKGSAPASGASKSSKDTGSSGTSA